MRLRRQRLFVLLFAAPVSLVLGVLLGGTWILVHLLSDIGLVAYLIHLRRAAQAELRLRAAREARERWIADERAARRAGAGAAAGAGAGSVDDRPDGASDTEHERFTRTDAEAATAVTSPAAWKYPPSGLDAEGTARWAAEYAPVRLSDALDGELTEAERAVAEAETVDLGTLMDAAREQVEADERARAEAAAEAAAEAEAAAQRQWVIDGDVEASHVHESGVGDTQEGSAHETEPDVTDVTDVTEEPEELEVHQPASYGGGGGRSNPGRPPARQRTSKPGRVQVNPPGTHGGLIAPPGAAAATAPASHAASAESDPAEPAAGTTAPAAAAAGGGDPDELEELLRRHAVGS